MICYYCLHLLVIMIKTSKRHICAIMAGRMAYVLFRAVVPDKRLNPSSPSAICVTDHSH